MSEQVRFKIEGCKVNPDLASICITFVKDENGEYVRYADYARLKDEVERLRASSFVTAVPVEEYEKLKAEVERLEAVSTIEQRTIQGLQQTPEWSEIARLTAYCRELEEKTKHLDLFKSVVEKFFNSADLKNPLDAQSCYALAEKLKQLPDSILDFTEEQVRDNPAWALAVFRHKVKEMQYKRIHDLNAIGGEQEENTRIVEELEQRCRELNLSIGQQAVQLRQIGELQAEVERLESDLKLEKENEDRLVRNWQHANNEVHGLKSQVAALIDEQTRLKAEVERLEPELEQRCRDLNLSIALQAILLRQIGELQSEVERLRKAGDGMEEVIWLNGCLSGMQIKERAVKAWNAAKEGKQS